MRYSLNHDLGDCWRLGYVTKYSGADATLGLAFAQTAWIYPFFGAMLGGSAWR